MATIVIIDDEPFVRSLVHATLDFGEHELHEAEDGESGLALVAQRSPDLILLDLGLPGRLGGLDVLRLLPSRARVVILTGSGGGQEAEARAAGAKAFLTKPFSPLQLIACLEGALGAP